MKKITNYPESRPSRLALISGSGAGIGAAIADHLIGTGWNLALCNRSITPRMTALKQLGSVVEADVTCYTADFTVDESVRNLHATILESQGVPDAVIHCVGPIHYSPEVIPPGDVWMEMFAGNLLSAVHLLRYVLPEMKRCRSGRVILFGFSGIGSSSGYRTIAPYAAAKHGLYSLMRSCAKSVSSDGITVNMISPGIVQPPEHESRPNFRAMLPKIPMSRFAEMGEITGAVSWLLSPESRAITGQNIKISGGLHISTTLL